MCVSGMLKCGLIRWTGKYDNISFRIKTPYWWILQEIDQSWEGNALLNLKMSRSQWF